MANDNLFEINWDGLDELAKMIDTMGEESEKIVMEEYTKFGLFVEEGAKKLVHHEEGDLEDSINFDQAVKEDGAIIVRGGANSDYALRRHEEPGIGTGTSGKPSWRGYSPGPKYLENAIKATEKDYEQMNIRALERILGHGS